MEERLSQLESKVEELTLALRAVTDRLARLEADRRPWHELVEEPADALGSPETTAPEGDVVGVLSLVGRSFLAIAGAYLLRALTSEDYLPQAIGVAAGLAYAALWILAADRVGGRGARLSATFHGVTAVLLAVPLIWETTVRFAIVAPLPSAAALTGITALTLLTAWRRDLRVLAWIVSLAAGAAALMLGGSTHTPMPFALLLVLLGGASLWLTRERSWNGLPWLTAAMADLAVWLLYAEDPIAKGWATLGGVVSIQLALFAIYVASFAWRAWQGEEGVTLLACLQTATSLATGFVGALALLRSQGAETVLRSPAAGAVLAASGLLLAAGFYGIAFFGLERRRKRSALFFTSLALALLIVASTSLWARPALLWSVLAIAGSALGTRFERLTPSLHAAIYALAACVASGLVRQSAAVWGLGPAEWPAIPVDSLAALAATAACLAFPVTGDLAFWRRYAHLPKLVFLVLFVVAGGGLVVRAAGTLVSEPGTLATVRTAVLATATLVLAVAGRLERLREAFVLVYPVLVLGAVKLLVEDFPAGRPQTLFVSLAFYGAALILAPRLLRAGRR